MKFELPMYGKINLSEENIKLGKIFSDSTLAGNKPIFIKKTGLYLYNPNDASEIGFCPETCPFLQDGSCYAAGFCKLYPGCRKNYLENNKLLYYNEEAYYKLIGEFIKTKKFLNSAKKNAINRPVFRRSVSGDMKSIRDVYYMIDICKNNPDVTIYLYTHHTFIFDDELYNQIPDNLIVNVSLSDYMSEDIKKRFPKYNQFVVTTSDKIPKNAIRCPSCSTNRPKNSVKCADCCRCFTKTTSGNGRITYELIRV